MAHLLNKGKGHWKAQFSVGFEGGQRKRLSRTFKVDPAKTETAQRREVEKLAAAYETDLQRGILTASSRITIKQLSEEWYESYVKRNKLSPVTQAHYRLLLDGRILPRIGSLVVQEVTSRSMNSFITWVENDVPKSRRAKGEKLSGTTCKKYHTLLHSLFEFAIRQGYITVNPIAATVSPKKDTPEKPFYTADQSALLLEALDQEPILWRAYFYLALYSQLRRGELVALDWPDIDLDHSIISVSKSAYSLPGGGVMLKEPKSTSGRRLVTIPASVCALLEELKADHRLQRLRSLGKWQDTGAVFTQSSGQRICLDSPAGRLKKIVTRYKLPPISPHGLRHTGASLLIASGEDYKTIQHRLGHSRASTTLDIYAHHLDHRDAEASSKLDSILETARKIAK